MLQALSSSEKKQAVEETCRMAASTVVSTTTTTAVFEFCPIQELYLLNQSGNSVTRSPRKSWHGGLSPACAKCQQGDVMQSRFRLNSKKIGGGL